MAYAEIVDVEKGFRTFEESEKEKATALIDEAGVIIDAYAPHASKDVKKVVTCRMVRRAIGDGQEMQTFPMGATQGSIGALGYTQSWTLNNGSVGELYLAKTEKQLLGIGNKLGSHSPLESLL